MNGVKLRRAVGLFGVTSLHFKKCMPMMAKVSKGFPFQPHLTADSINL